MSEIWRLQAAVDAPNNSRQRVKSIQTHASTSGKCFLLHAYSIEHSVLSLKSGLVHTLHNKGWIDQPSRAVRLREESSRPYCRRFPGVHCHRQIFPAQGSDL